MLTKDKNSIVLLHGIFDEAAYDLLKTHQEKDVFILEGRPNLESGRALSRELMKRKIKPTLITDNMAGFLFAQNLVKEVWLTYYVLENDQSLCPVGALILAVLGKKHGIPVYLYPSESQSGLLGRPKDLFYFNGKQVAASGIKGYVPLVDWVPNKYITKINAQTVVI